MSIPTSGEEFSKLIEYLRKAQEASAMLAHLTRDNDPVQAKGWLGISELMGRMVIQGTKLATGRLQ